MKLFIVRHGETDMNVQGLIQSHSNSQLNNNGKLQAEKIASRLKNETFNHAYTSDLERASETAKIILQYHPEITLLETVKLREKHAGELEGMSKKGAVIKFNRIRHTFHGFKPKGGESFIEAQQRISAFYEELIENHKGEHILLVAHGGIIGALLLYIFDKPIIWKEYNKHRPSNAALTILEIEDTKKHTIHIMNCIEHLK